MMHLHLSIRKSERFILRGRTWGGCFFSISFIKAGSSQRSKRFRASSSTGDIWDKSKKGDEGGRGRGEGGFTAPTLPLKTHFFFLSLHWLSRNNSIRLDTQPGRFPSSWLAFCPEGALKRFTRGGSAPRSNPLPLFCKKGTPFVYLLLTNGSPFTYLTFRAFCILFTCCKGIAIKVWIQWNLY